MITTDELPQLQSDIGNFITEQPPQAEERSRIPDDLLGLANSPIPIRLAVLPNGGDSGGHSPPLRLGEGPQRAQKGPRPSRAQSSRHQPAQAHAGGTRCSSLPRRVKVAGESCADD